MRASHTFYSTFPPDTLFQKLTELLDDENVSWRIKPPYWLIKFELSSKIQSSPTPLTEDSMKAGPSDVASNSSLVSEKAIVTEKTIVQVEIMHVPEQAKYAVVFERNGGSSRLFHISVQKYLLGMQICNDAVLDQIEMAQPAAATH